MQLFDNYNNVSSLQMTDISNMLHEKVKHHRNGASNHGCTNFPLPSEITSTVDCTDNWDSDIDSDSIALDKKCAEKIKLVLPRVDLVNETEDLRPPRGYSEAMLKEFNDDSVMEDTESIYSSSGIGRGRIIQEIQMKLIGWGRGKNSSI